MRQDKIDPSSPPGSPSSAGPFSPKGSRRSPNFLSDSSDSEDSDLEITLPHLEKAVTTEHFSPSTLQNLQKILGQQAKLTLLEKISYAKVLVTDALSKIPHINVGSIEQDGVGKVLSFATDGAEKKLLINKRIGEGNNGTVYLATVAETEESLVVKSISVYNKTEYKKNKRFVLDSELISRIIREHQNMNTYNLDSDLIYDPASMTLYVTMPQYQGVTAKKMISGGSTGLVAQIKHKIEKGDERAALALLRDMFQVLKGALQAVNDFHNKTTLIHGDAWLDNFMVSKCADGSFEVNLIDFGACCQSGITGEEYLAQKLQVGIGDFHTAPEIPSQSNKKSQELKAQISAESDLHAIAASFVFEAMLELFDCDRVKSHDGRSENIDVIGKDFMLWAMTNACNSDWFLNMGEPMMQQAKELRGAITVDGSVAKRVSVRVAIAKVQGFIARIDALARQSSANLERYARYADLERITKDVSITQRVEKYNKVVRPEEPGHHNEHPH